MSTYRKFADELVIYYQKEKKTVEMDGRVFDYHEGFVKSNLQDNHQTAISWSRNKTPIVKPNRFSGYIVHEMYSSRMSQKVMKLLMVFDDVNFIVDLTVDDFVRNVLPHSTITNGRINTDLCYVKSSSGTQYTVPYDIAQQNIVETYNLTKTKLVRGMLYKSSYGSAVYLGKDNNGRFVFFKAGNVFNTSCATSKRLVYSQGRAQSNTIKINGKEPTTFPHKHYIAPEVYIEVNKHDLGNIFFVYLMNLTTKTVVEKVNMKVVGEVQCFSEDECDKLMNDTPLIEVDNSHGVVNITTFK